MHGQMRLQESKQCAKENAKERQEEDGGNMHASKHRCKVQARGLAARAVVCVPELARC